MTADQNEALLPNEQDSVMVYFNPELLQSMADVSAKKQRNFRELLSSAEEGDLDAAYHLAHNYCRGEEGAPQDEQQGFYWFSKAAEVGHIAAQYSLGMCYIKGIGTEENAEKAVELFSGAAELGYLPAVCELGLCY